MLQKNSFPHLCLQLLLCIFCWSSLQAQAKEGEYWAIWDQANEQSTETIDHSLWQGVLTEYLDDQHPSGINLFDYAAVSDDQRDNLDDYLEYLQEIDPREYTRAEQMAYWVNFYNALTVQVVLENYPARTILTMGDGLFSIGPWSDELVDVAGQGLTLDDIEHRILRPIWKDYRIHFAVNCASMGCPNLQKAAFTVDNTEALLNQGTVDFLKHPRGLKIKGKKLVLSEIFDWYGVDFGENEQAVLQVLAKHTNPDVSEFLKSYNGKIKYQYDWKLNKPKKK